MLLRLTACAIAFVLVACSGRAAMITGGITTLVGVATIVDAEGEAGAFTESDVRLVGLGLILAGGILFFVGLASDGPDDAPPAAEPPEASRPVVVPPQPVTPLPASQLEIQSPMANQLALQASSAARRDDCAAARASGSRLLKLDADVHRKLVAIDVAYARCLRE